MERMISLNRSWRFSVDDPVQRAAASADHQWKFRGVKAGQADGFAAAGYDDTHWETVDLPHDYGVRTAFSPAHIHMCGAKEEVNVWYRKNFLMDECYADRHFTLIFEGISMKAEIYFNGSLVASVPGAYTWTQIDVTPRMHFGKAPNYIAVFVRGDAQQVWKYEGVGIYDHVRLLVRDPVHAVYNGVWTYVRHLEEDRWQLHCEAEIENSLYEARQAAVQFTLLDDRNQPVGSAEERVFLEPDSRGKVKAVIPVASPRLWETEDPYLYRVCCRVLCDGQETDREQVPGAFRTAEFIPDQGFFLNGKKVLLKGFSNHFEHAGIGFAVPESVSEYRIRRIKSMGANAYRCAHNECPESLLDVCDRLGILVMDENRMFETREENLIMLRNQIRRNRKHPCVILYGLFSEEPLQSTAEGARIYRKLKSVASKEDATRLFTGSAQRVADCAENASVVAAMDVVGLNYEPDNWDRIRSQFPAKAVLATEMTCMQTMRGELRYDPQKLLFDDYAQKNHWFGFTVYESWKHVLAHPYLAGVFHHSAFDHRGEPQPLDYPLVCCSYGAMDTCGFPKTMYYIYQSWFQSEPMMHLFPHWNHTPGETVQVLAVTNCDACELILNGTSLGLRTCRPCEPCLWEVPFAPGTLRAVGYRNAEPAAEDEVTTAGAPARLVLQTHKQSLRNDGYDAVVVDVCAVDAAGNPCPDANDPVVFSAEGGKILGVGNGNPASHEADHLPQRKLFHGKCQAIVACMPGSDRLTLRAQACGMTGGEAVLEVEKTDLFRLLGSDSRLIDSWKISCCATQEKPDPDMRIDWSENNAFIAVNMSSERFQNGLQPGWMLYRADVAIPCSAGKDCTGSFCLGLAKYKTCEIWINGECLFTDLKEADETVRNIQVPLRTGGTDLLRITVLLQTSGGKAGMNGRDREICLKMD